MRIAVVGKYPPVAEGISDYARYVVGSLARRPEVAHVTVIANAHSHSVPSHQNLGNVEVRRVWRANSVGLSYRLLHEVLRVRPDVVWYNVSLAMFGDGAPAVAGFLLPALTRRLGIRSIVTLHEWLVDDLGEVGAPDGAMRRLGLAFGLRLLLGSDVVAVTVNRLAETLKAWLLPGRAEIVYLPLCGYDEPILEPFQDPPTVLMLTSHAPHKNLPLLIEAFGRVRARVPMARLAVAGIDHPRFPGYLASVQRSHRHRPGVEWLGPIPAAAMRATFCRATVTVAPYRAATGSSATVHRAVGLGRPVVAADLREFRWMAEEEDLWLEFFPRDDATALATVLARLLTDPARCQEIARHNLRSARRNSLATTTEAYVRLFRGSAAPSLATGVSYSPSGGLSP